MKYQFRNKLCPDIVLCHAGEGYNHPTEAGAWTELAKILPSEPSEGSLTLEDRYVIEPLGHEIDASDPA